MSGELDRPNEAQQYNPAEILSQEPTFEEVQRQKERCVESVKDATKMKEHLGELGADQKILDNPAFLGQLSIVLRNMEASQEGWTPTEETLSADGFSVASINAKETRKVRTGIDVNVRPDGSLNIVTGYSSRERYRDLNNDMEELVSNSVGEYSFTINKDGVLFLHEDSSFDTEQATNAKDFKRGDSRFESTTKFSKDGEMISFESQHVQGATFTEPRGSLSMEIGKDGGDVPTSIAGRLKKPIGVKTSEYYIREKDGTVTAYRSKDGKESVKINTREWHGDLAVTFDSAEAILNEEWHKKNGD